jgi:hypothetical protein
VEQHQVEMLVRFTARVSAAAFVAALLLFSLGDRRHPRGAWPEIRLFVAFVLAHTIHFGTVVWLAVITDGENIRQREGWPVVLTVAVLFYLSAFGILRAWHSRRSGRVMSRAGWLMAQSGVALIAVVFLNSYLSRVERMPVYWIPTIVMVIVAAMYFARLRRMEPPARTSQAHVN